MLDAKLFDAYAEDNKKTNWPECVSVRTASIPSALRYIEWR